MSNMRSGPPKTQSRRVAAWIYAVLNPVIESLQRERELLERRNLTWRFYSGQSEFIRMIQEYVDSVQWPNFYDFLAEHPFFAKAFKQHDDQLEKTNAIALQTFDELISWPEFSSTIEKLLSRYRQQRRSAGFSEDPPFHTEGDLVKYSAEYLINNIQELPSHYSLSGFWNASNELLLSFRNLPRFRPLEKAIE
jgi:hypothetical protein